MEEQQVLEGMPESPVSPHVELFEFLATTIVNLYMKVEPITSSESWGTWNLEDKVTFRESMHQLAKVTTAIRTSFDQPIWKNRITGVEPVRAKSSRGSDTEELTTEEKLNKLLGR